MSQSRFLIKICGVTRPEDAAYAASVGVDAIGLNLWQGSKRFVDEPRAREIMAALPRGVLRIGVFVNAHPLVVTESITDLGLDRVQLHGDERVGDWDGVPRERLVRAVRVLDESSIKENLGWDAGLWIYDAYTQTYGGSGARAPWPIIATMAERPFLLAGGLNAGNVAEAIAATHPDGVDVASGVESSPGIKDHAKLAAFVKAARAAAALSRR